VGVGGAKFYIRTEGQDQKESEEGKGNDDCRQDQSLWQGIGRAGWQDVHVERDDRRHKAGDAARSEDREIDRVAEDHDAEKNPDDVPRQHQVEADREEDAYRNGEDRVHQSSSLSSSPSAMEAKEPSTTR